MEKTNSSSSQKGRTTSVIIQKHLDQELEKRGMKLTFLVHNALEWKDRMEEQTKELEELRQFKNTADIKINRLTTENLDLFRFKSKVLEEKYGPVAKK